LQPILLIFVYLIIGAYGLLAVHLVAHGILDLRKRDRNGRSSIRSLDESRTISDRVAALRKCEWANRWLPRNIELNVPVARTPGWKVAG